MLYSQSPPLAENERAQENSHGNSPKTSVRGFSREHEARNEPRFGRQSTSASIHPLPPPRPRSSIGRRMFRAVTRFAIAVLIGVGATLGWQAYGDTARETLAARAPELAWLAPAARTKPVAAAPAIATVQLEPLASSLEMVRRSVEQLAFNQEQMARNIAALQAIDEDIRQKVSAPPPAPVQPAAAIAPPKPAPPKPQPSGASASPAPRPSAPGPVSLAPR
jgi:hypothetical protein